MDIVTDFTAEAMSYLSLFQDIQKNNPQNVFLKRLLNKELSSKEAWEQLELSEIEVKELRPQQKDKIKDLVWHSPSITEPDVLLSKHYFTITLHLLQWLAANIQKTKDDTTEDNTLEILLSQFDENDKPNLFRPPFFWRQHIREVLFTYPEKRISLAEKLKYVPLQLILALDKNEINSYKIRLCQFYVEAHNGDDLTKDSVEILSNEDRVFHNTWWKNRYDEAHELLLNDKKLLEKLKENEVTLPFDSLFRDEIIEISKARKFREKELNFSKTKNESTEQENLESNDINDFTPFDPFKKAQDMKLMGIAFSGGGIRSASFNLGVLQRLASLNTLHRFDYISSVSGGGYIATWFNSWIKRAGSLSKVSDRLNPYKSSDPLADEVRPIRWLRMFSNYLSPNTGIMSTDSWTSGMTWIRNTLVIQFVLLLTLISVLSLISDIFHLSYWLKSLLKTETFNTLPYYTIFGIITMLFLIGSILSTIGMRSFHRTDKVHNTKIIDKLKPIIPHLLVGWATICAFIICTFFSAKFTSTEDNIAIFFALLISFLFLAFRYIYHSGNNMSKRKNSYLVIRIAIIHSSIIASGIMAILLAIFWDLIIKNSFYFTGDFFEDIEQEKILLVIGIPIVLEIFSAALFIRMVLLGRLFPHNYREWWGRMSGYIHRFIFFWILLSFASLIMPHLWNCFINQKNNSNFLTIFGISGGWVGLIGWGVKKAFEANDQNKSKSKAVTTPIIKAISYLFILSFLLIGSWITEEIRFALSHEFQCKSWYNPFWITFCLANITAAVSWRVEVNEFSLQHFYRNRLTRAFLGATRTWDDRIKTANDFTGFDTKDDIPLADMITKNNYFGPYPVINTTLNATVVSALDRQDRKGESFIFTPLYFGYDFSPTRSSTYNIDHVYEYGYRPTKEFAANDGGLSIGTAMAISGAAVNPNWGHDSSSSLAFLLTVFNVRLGWWIGNPRLKKWKESDPKFGFLYLLMDLMGKSDIEKDYICLSDGGHFDNMGLYELVRRRCKYILLSDAEQDQEGTSKGLANAIRRCRIDFGVEIDIDLDDLFKKANDKDHKVKHIVKGKIIYPGEQQQIGKLVYIKTTLSGDEPVDIREYALANPDFPQQSTIDQFFDEAQFESYRKLGYHSIKNIQELGL